MRVQQIDLKTRTISLLPGETKNDRGLKVIMTEEVFQLLKELGRGKKPNDAVFTWSSGKDSGKPILDFRGSWERITNAAGVSVLFHDFRRTAVRNMVRAKISKHVAKRISGHSTDSVFDRYDIVDERDLEDATRKLESSGIGGRLVAVETENDKSSASH